MSDSLTIACDIDSTIYPAESLYDEACWRVFGKSFYQDGNRNWYNNEELIAMFGENYGDIFAEALSPRHFPRRVLYDGVEDVLREIQGEGIRVHFVTQNRVPGIRDPLHRWLKDCFGDEVGLSITTQEKKGPILKRIGALCLIDDAPPHLQSALELGIPTYAKRQVWNEKFLKNHPEVTAFDEWEEIHSLLEEVTSEVVAA